LAEAPQDFFLGGAPSIGLVRRLIFISECGLGGIRKSAPIRRFVCSIGGDFVILIS
jgi:hypothetical protein